MATQGIGSVSKVPRTDKVSVIRRPKTWVIGIVAVQVAIPALALFHEPPTRLGWQMYSGNGELPKIIVETTNGNDKEIAFTDVAATSRAELDWTRSIPAYVCDQVGDAATVRLIYSTATESFGCG